MRGNLERRGGSRTYGKGLHLTVSDGETAYLSFDL